MKNLLALALTFGSFAILANEPTTTTPDTAAINPVTAPAPKTASVDSAKMSRKAKGAAKAACKAEGKKWKAGKCQ